MVAAQFNIFDTVILLVMFLSIVLAFFRGFVREVLSLFSWVGAAFITVYYLPTVSAMLEPHFKSKLVVGGIAGLGTYICALMVLSIITSLIMRYVKKGNEVGVLDNLLGMGFGALRGAFVVSLGFLLLTFMMTPDNYPVWIKEARTKEYVEQGAQILAQIAPNYIHDITTSTREIAAEAKNEAPSPSDAMPSSGIQGPSDTKWMNVDSLKQMIDKHADELQEHTQ